MEYRVEQHLEALKDRLGALGFVTRNVTRGGVGEEKEIPTSMDLQAGGGSSGVGPAPGARSRAPEHATCCSGGKRSIQLSYGPLSLGRELWAAGLDAYPHIIRSLG